MRGIAVVLAASVAAVATAQPRGATRRAHDAGQGGAYRRRASRGATSPTRRSSSRTTASRRSGPPPSSRPRPRRTPPSSTSAAPPCCPGLIDCHAHLLSSMRARRTTGENILVTVAEMSASQRALLGAANAREALEAGITTVRNVGHSGVDGDAALRDAVNEGWVAGPRMQAATRKLTPAGRAGAGPAARGRARHRRSRVPDRERAGGRAARRARGAVPRRGRDQDRDGRSAAVPRRGRGAGDRGRGPSLGAEGRRPRHDRAPRSRTRWRPASIPSSTATRPSDAVLAAMARKGIALVVTAWRGGQRARAVLEVAVPERAGPRRRRRASSPPGRRGTARWWRARARPACASPPAPTCGSVIRRRPAARPR